MENTSGKGPTPKYPWRTLQIGESFFVHENVANQHAVRCNAYQSGQRLGRRFSVRRQGAGVIIIRLS